MDEHKIYFNLPLSLIFSITSIIDINAARVTQR